MRHRRQRARGARGATPRLRHGGLAAGRDRGVRDARGPDRGLARCARPRSASSGCAPSRTGTSPQPSFPGLAVREAQRTGSLRPLRRDGREPLPPDASTTFSPHAERRARAKRLEPELRASGASSAIRAVDGGFELDGDGPFAHVLVATGHPGPARRDARAPCTPTSRTSTRRASRSSAPAWRRRPSG